MLITRVLLFTLSFSLAVCLAAPVSHAAIIASTNFDGRTLATTLVANDTAANLNWTTNGIADPGNMNAVTAGGVGQALFNSTTLTQNMFAPALNVGNGSAASGTHFWTTTVPLAVLAGNTVTLESVALQYSAISGSAALNVNRVSDFTISLFDPSSALVEAVSITDALSGTTAVPQSPTLTFNFAPVVLSLPGTYTLRIQGGDYAGTNETGNHTGIDNLSIQGTITAIPEPATWAMLTAGLLFSAWRLRHKRSTAAL